MSPKRIIVWCSHDDFGRGGHLWVDSVARLGDHGVKAIVVISSIVDCPDCSIGFVDRIRSFHHVPISLLVLGLMVPSVGIWDSIAELVLGVGLKYFHNLCFGILRSYLCEVGTSATESKQCKVFFISIYIFLNKFVIILKTKRNTCSCSSKDKTV